jgi:hypothetical protein
LARDAMESIKGTEIPKPTSKNSQPHRK